jgi:predicted membrane protein
MDDNKNSIKIGSNRSFGIVFSIVFLIISFYPLTKGNEIFLWSLILSIIFLVLGIINSILLKPLNFVWFKFGIFLGSFVSPIVMGLVYFAVVFPTFLILRIFKKNYLNINYEKNKLSYWINIKDRNNSMEDQF